MSDDDLWLVDIFSNAQSAPEEPRIQLLPLYDYKEALRYARVFRIKLDNGTPLEADIERSLRCPCRTRFVAHWIPVPWGAMAFCGIFFKSRDRDVLSQSFAIFSQDDAMKPQILSRLHLARQQYRAAVRTSHGLPVPLDGAETN